MVGDLVIYGVDFSGAHDAGDKIWIAKGARHAKGLLIKECSSAGAQLKSGKELLPCLAALVKVMDWGRTKTTI